MHRPFNPVILLLGVYPSDICSHVRNNTGTRLFMAELYVIAFNWKHPDCPSVVVWLNKAGTVHMMQCSEAVKKERKFFLYWHGMIYSDEKKKSSCFCVKYVMLCVKEIHTHDSLYMQVISLLPRRTVFLEF